MEKSSIKQAAKAIGMERPPVNRVTFTMIQQPGKAPKLRIKAAESRYMLPVVVYMPNNFPRKIPTTRSSDICVSRNCTKCIN